jgi:hypothetical protein
VLEEIEYELDRVPTGSRFIDRFEAGAPVHAALTAPLSLMIAFAQHTFYDYIELKRTLSVFTRNLSTFPSFLSRSRVLATLLSSTIVLVVSTANSAAISVPCMTLLIDEKRLLLLSLV